MEKHSSGIGCCVVLLFAIVGLGIWAEVHKPQNPLPQVQVTTEMPR